MAGGVLASLRILLMLDSTGVATGVAGARSAMTGLQTAVGIGAVAMVAAEYEAVKAAAGFQSQLNTINTVAQTTPDKLNAIGAGILDVEKKTGLARDDLVAGYYDIVSANIKVADAQGILYDASELAVGGMGTESQAIDILTSTINAYGGDTSKATQYTNELAMSVKLGKQTVADLSLAYSQVVPIAALYGISNAEIASSLATLTDQGMEASQAATYMRQTINSLVKPTTDLKYVLDALGMSTDDVVASIKTNGFVATWQTILDKAKEMGIGIAGLTGRIQAQQYLAGTAVNNNALYRDILDQVTHSSENGGEAARQMAEKQKGLDYVASILRANVDALAIAFGTGLLPALTPIVQMFVFLVSGLTNILNLNPDITSFFAMIVTGLSTILALKFGARMLAMLLPLPGALRLVSTSVLTLAGRSAAADVAGASLGTKLLSGLGRVLRGGGALIGTALADAEAVAGTEAAVAAGVAGTAAGGAFAAAAAIAVAAAPVIVLTIALAYATAPGGVLEGAGQGLEQIATGIPTSELMGHLKLTAQEAAQTWTSEFAGNLVGGKGQLWTKASDAFKASGQGADYVFTLAAEQVFKDQGEAAANAFVQSWANKAGPDLSAGMHTVLDSPDLWETTTFVANQDKWWAEIGANTQTNLHNLAKVAASAAQLATWEKQGAQYFESLGQGMQSGARSLLPTLDTLKKFITDGLKPKDLALQAVGKDYVAEFVKGMHSKVIGSQGFFTGVGFAAIEAIAGAGDGTPGHKGMKAIGTYFTHLLGTGMTTDEILAHLAADGVTVTDAVKAVLLDKAGYRAGGEAITSSFMDGAIAGIWANFDRLHRAYSDAFAMFHGQSPPKVGPLMHIDQWGTNVARAWTDPFIAQIEQGGRDAERSLTNMDAVLGRSRIFGEDGSGRSVSGLTGAVNALARPGASSPTNSYSAGGVTINVNGADDPETVARRVREALDDYFDGASSGKSLRWSPS